MTSAISGQKHLRLRAGLSSLLSNAVAKQEATCWEGDVKNSDTANSQSVRVTVWCEKQMLHLPLQICIRNFVGMRIFWWLKPLRFENCFLESWSLSLKQEWKFWRIIHRILTAHLWSRWYFCQCHCHHCQWMRRLKWRLGEMKRQAHCPWKNLGSHVRCYFSNLHCFSSRSMPLIDNTLKREWQLVTTLIFQMDAICSILWITSLGDKGYCP